MPSTPTPAHRAAGRTPSSRRARPRAVRAYALVLAASLALISAPGTTAAAQTFKVLYRFGALPDGNSPLAGLLLDADGNLYGTTRYGGANSCPGGDGAGCGTVFKLDTNGAETVLYNFTGPDGANPSGNVIMDAVGNLYGTTEYGGLTNHCGGEGSYPGCGVVFELSGGEETVLYRFTGGSDGAFPWPGVIMNAAGALYGTTNSGGSAGDGVAFKLVGTKETVLHSFCSWLNCADGGYITAGLIMDSKGNLYGTATYGGDYLCDYPEGCGVVFKLSGKKETVIHSFKDNPDGDEPMAALFMDAEGNLYGTTELGGGNGKAGTVFELDDGRKERILHRFRPYTKGGDARSTSVVQDASGNLYGTTEANVYEITVDGKEEILHIWCSWKDCSDGAIPNDLIIDAKGNLYGTTYGGGINGNGVIFMITP